MSDPEETLRMADQEIADAEKLAELAREYINGQQRARRERLKAEGRCTVCGKPAPVPKRTCLTCRRRHNRRRRPSRHST